MKYFVMLMLALMQRFSFAETIASTILRNNSAYTAYLQYVSPSYTPLIVNSFSRVVKVINPDKLIFLRVIENTETSGVTDGNTVIVNVLLEHMSEVEREFIIAHEAGHIMLKHRDLKIHLFEKYIKGEVTNKKLKIANQKIKIEMRQLSYRCELSADTFALRTLIKLGWTRDQVIISMLDKKRTFDTATHPSLAKRILNLKNTSI